jgi:hypothetical protein
LKFGRVEPEHVARKFELRLWRENHQMQSVSFEGAGAGDWGAMMGVSKRKRSETQYTPCFGLVTSHQITLAIEEFKRLESEGNDHGRVLVAQRVNLAKWRRTRLLASFGSLAIEADYEDIEATKETKADLYISKLPGLAHDCGLAHLMAPFLAYITANGNILQCGGGTVHLPGRDRHPDTAMRPVDLPGENPLMPRVIGEIEITHRALREILEYNAQLFAGIPQLRTAIFLKVYTRHTASRRFAALALLFRRLPGGVVCTDAVSCGTAPLGRSVVNSLPPAIGGILRLLGIPPVVTQANPWPAAENPAITIPAADPFYWRDDPATGAPVLIPGAPAPGAAPDLRICLWNIIWRVNSHDPFS